jgi:hypothetical protein
MTYYRLMQVSVTGSTRFSFIVKVGPSNKTQRMFIHNTIFNNNIQLLTTTSKNEEYSLEMYSISGILLSRQKNMMHAGTNSTALVIRSAIKPGIYLLVIRNDKGEKVYHSKLVKIN